MRTGWNTSPITECNLNKAWAMFTSVQAFPLTGCGWRAAALWYERWIGEWAGVGTAVCIFTPILRVYTRTEVERGKLLHSFD